MSGYAAASRTLPKPNNLPLWRSYPREAPLTLNDNRLDKYFATKINGALNRVLKVFDLDIDRYVVTPLFAKSYEMPRQPTWGVRVDTRTRLGALKVPIKQTTQELASLGYIRATDFEMNHRIPRHDVNS